MLVVLVRAWADCSTWLWHLLDSQSPSQRARGVSRAGPAPGTGRALGLSGRVTEVIQSHSSAHRQLLMPAKLR